MSTRFRYAARGGAGRIERGDLDADSLPDAVERLRRRRLTPLTLKPAPASATALISDLAARDLARTLAQLMRAGLSFTQALRFAAEHSPGQAGVVAARMHEAAERGDPASSALEDFQGAQALLLRGVVRAGEASGKLADALEVAAASFARSAELKGRIATAMIYPSFVIVATMATLGVFLLVVVPTLGLAFEGAEDRLPASTRALLSFSAWLRAEGGAVAALAAAITTLALISPGAKRVVKSSVDQLLASPLGLGIAPRLEYAAFAGLAALSLQAGVPAASALEAAASSVRNTTLHNALRRAVAAIRTGEAVSHALAAAAAPKTLLRLAVIGEETGHLGQTLKHASTLLASEAEQQLERLGAIAGPIITLVIGAMVASVVMSLFLGLMTISDLAML